MGESGYAISSWSASAGYSASMLTEDAKVDSSSTRQLLRSSVNISAEYPALPDHDSMNNPSVCGFVPCLKCWINLWIYFQFLWCMPLCIERTMPTILTIVWTEASGEHSDLKILMWILWWFQLIKHRQFGGKRLYLYTYIKPVTS